MFYHFVNLDTDTDRLHVTPVFSTKMRVWICVTKELWTNVNSNNKLLTLKKCVSNCPQNYFRRLKATPQRRAVAELAWVSYIHITFLICSLLCFQLILYFNVRFIEFSWILCNFIFFQLHNAQIGWSVAENPSLFLISFDVFSVPYIKNVTISSH